MAKRERLCYVCAHAPARSLKAQGRVAGKSAPVGTYVNATTDPVFCSVRCAANWALINVAHAEGGVEWCGTHGWANAHYGCLGCAEEERENSDGQA